MCWFVVFIGQTQAGKPINYDIYEYKVLGRLSDVTPIEFFKIQVDLESRKEWDYLIIFLELLDKHVETSTELIRWVMRFPYPLYPREYVCVRRHCIDPDEMVLVYVSEAIPECKIEHHHHHHQQQQHHHNQHPQHQHQHSKTGFLTSEGLK